VNRLWRPHAPDQFGIPVVFQQSVPELFWGAWRWQDKGTDGSILINRQLDISIDQKASGSMTYGLVQSQVNGCVQQDIWNWNEKVSWAWDGQQLQFNGSGNRYESF
jgi:hypothetical protein